MKNIANTIELPDCWEDLTQQQVAETVFYSFAYLSGKMNLYTYRFILLQLYTGYKRGKKKVTPDEAESINENLYNLASCIKFPIKPVYENPALLDVLTPELRQKLQTVFPFELTEPNELSQINMIFDMLKYRSVLNLNFKRNPVPRVQVLKQKLNGAVFNIDTNGDVQTNITAAMFTDAYHYYNLYNSLKEQQYLNILIAILYQPFECNYSLFDAQTRANGVKHLPYNTKQTVFYWFQGVMEWLFAHPVYGILFNNNSPRKGANKINLGMGEIIFSLSKDGYGTTTDIENTDLLKFLALQIKRLKDVVHELKAADIAINKISQKTGLSVETINSM